MSLAQLRERADRLRAIPLPSVLLAAGALPDPHDKAKWHTAQGVLSVTGAKFINWNQGRGGGGAIDLAMQLGGLGFQDALQWLGLRFPTAAAPPAPAPPVSKPPILRLPKPDPARLPGVIRYLLDDRCLPTALLQPLLASATLYADAHANAVFLLLGKKNTPVGAELRGTGPRPWRGMALGSQKDLGFFSVGPSRPKAIILCESAIDALSCLWLHPYNRCLSTAGARPSPRWVPALLDQGPPIYCGFDSDPTGDAMADAMIRSHPTIRRLRPRLHDWNDILRSLHE